MNNFNPHLAAMPFYQEHWYDLSRTMRKEIVAVQYDIAIDINKAHSRIRSMR